MHFPFFDKFSDSMENFQNVTVSRKISRFSSAKISDDVFLVIDHKFRISPYFPCFSTFSPCFAKIIIPSLSNISPLFSKNSPAFTYFRCISFPLYFDHNAAIHHPMHGRPYTDRRLWWMVFGVDTRREAWRRICIKRGFAKEECFQFLVNQRAVERWQEVRFG